MEHDTRDRYRQIAIVNFLKVAAIVFFKWECFPKYFMMPEKYDGKRIRVVGYLHLEFEGNAIYSTMEDYKRGMIFNGFWVSFSEKQTKKLNPRNFNDRYVRMVGTFSGTSKGHRDAFGGSLYDITRFSPYEF